jgi:DNA polymerase elongation subunit (family B)
METDQEELYVLEIFYHAQSIHLLLKRKDYSTVILPISGWRSWVYIHSDSASPEEIHALGSKICSSGKEYDELDYEVVQRRRLFGFHEPEYVPFLLIRGRHTFLRYQSDKWRDPLFHQIDGDVEIYEDKIDVRSKFVAETKISAGGWVSLPQYVLHSINRVEDKVTWLNCAPHRLVTSLSIMQKPPLVIAAFDLETDGFGLHTSCIKQASLVTWKIGHYISDPDDVNAMVFCSQPTATEGPDEVNVINCDGSEDLVARFGAAIRDLDPDCILGYNNKLFDNRRLMYYDQGLKSGMGKIGRYPLRTDKTYDFNCEREDTEDTEKVSAYSKKKHQLHLRTTNGALDGYEEDTKTSAKDKNKVSNGWCDLRIAGRVVYDLFPYAKSQYGDLGSYKLGDLGKLFVDDDKVDMPMSKTLESFTSSGTPELRRAVAKYCEQDAHLVAKLAEQWGTVEYYMELAHLSSVNPKTAAGGTQGILVGMIQTSIHNDCVWNPIKDLGAEINLRGAFVFDPIPGFYDRNDVICVLDYSSLYPSIMRAFKISPERLLIHSTPESIAGLRSRGFGVEEYNIDKETTVRMVSRPNDDRKPVFVDILERLLPRRAEYKNAMKLEKDPRKKEDYKRKQACIKVICNSLYGTLGVLGDAARMSIRHLAALITYEGQEIIKRTRDLIEAKFNPPDTKPDTHPDDKACYLVGGDTDSVFMLIRPPSSMDNASTEERLRWVDNKAEEMVRYVNSIHKAEKHDALVLTFEGKLVQSLFIKKKMYAGIFLPPGNFNLDSKLKLKGISVVRRDRPAFVPDIGMDLLNMTIRKGDRRGALFHLLDFCRSIMNNEIPLERFITTQGLKDFKSQGPHTSCAKRMRSMCMFSNLDPRFKSIEMPKTADRIRYVVCKNQPNNKVFRLINAKTDATVASRTLPPEVVDADMVDHDHYLKQASSLLLYITVLQGTRFDKAKEQFINTVKGQHERQRSHSLTTISKDYRDVLMDWIEREEKCARTTRRGADSAPRKRKQGSLDAFITKKKK